jgi:hypothetical protein
MSGNVQGVQKLTLRSRTPGEAGGRRSRTHGDPDAKSWACYLDEAVYIRPANA